MLKKLGALLIVLGFATSAFAQDSKKADPLPPELPNPNPTVATKPTHGAIVLPKDKKKKKTPQAKKAEKDIEAEVSK